jgi:hypothetical protein
VVVKVSPLDSETTELPICYLLNCDDVSTEDCAANALRSAQEQESVVWGMIDSVPNEIRMASSRSFYVQVEPNVDLPTLAGSWSEVGCVPLGGQTDAALFRLRHCRSNMPRWIEYMNSEHGSIGFLDRDEDYRRVCLRISD